MSGYRFYRKASEAYRSRPNLYNVLVITTVRFAISTSAFFLFVFLFFSGFFCSILIGRVFVDYSDS